MLKKILKWIFRIVLGLLTIVFTFGTIKQWNYDSKVEREYKPTGEFSDVGYNRIHFKSSGEGDFTFVLISGLGETMNTWSEIERELQNRGQVFMYDRSGLGHSEVGILPRSVDNIASELQTILEREKIKGPYILVGHSVGGFIARYFAKKYPEDVIGILLIDPYQEMGKKEFGEWPASYKIMNWSLRNLSWSGIPFFLLPKPPHPIYKTSKAIRTYGEEAFAEDVSLREFAKLDHGVSELPIYLLTADKVGSKYNDIQKRWHSEIFEKYTNDINKHVVVESGHHIHIENPHIVIEAFDEFINKLRTDY
jgi:pimeloyl-ACP methyl ester carboxylesterase